MRNKKKSRVVAIAVASVLLLSTIPMTAFASIANWSTSNVTYNQDTFGTNGYYNVISKKDYTLVPGAATETEMVLNNSSGTRRQVLHIIEVDPSNPDVSIVPGYYNIDKLANNPADSSAYKAAGVTDVADYYDTTLGYQVVGAMNTDLDYTDNAPRVLVYNGQILSGYAGASAPSSVLYVWNNDGEISCQVTDYKKSEMEAGVKNGTLLHAISVSFAMTVKNGELVSKNVERVTSAAARSMVGVKEDGTLVIVMNDGRGANNSVGLCSYELGESMLALGCKWAANCDGGGSSSFVSRRVGEEDLVCRCIPCDGAERPTKSSIIITSNVAPTGVLDNVNIDAEYDYFAPSTTYTFDAKAIDTHGYSMGMPSNAVWTLSDETFGTISNGTFVSNGKTGEVDIQVEVNDTIVGTKTINVANPTTLNFAQSSTVLPYGKSTTLSFVSQIGESEVYLDESSFKFELSNPNAGTLDGFVFTATKNESVESTNITAEYLPTGANYIYSIEFGKGSEIVWDFEDGKLGGFMSQDDAEQWQKDNGVSAFSALYGGGNISTCISEKVFIGTKENGGKVHNGEKSLGLTIDMTQVDFNNWVYANIYNVEGIKVLRDTANGNNATTFGMWVYIPKGFRTEENLGSIAIRFDFMAGKDKDHLVRTNFNGAYNGKNVNALTEADIPENRWIYVTTSLTGFNYVRTEDPTNGAEGYSPDLARMYVKPSVAQKLTYYFDDFTIDYSSAVDDRVPPVISNPEYAPADTNISFTDGVEITDISAGFTAYVSDDNSGIDASTGAIYVDGNKIGTTKVTGNMIHCDAVSMGVGEHKVKFEIADKLGNYTTLTRTIVSNSTNHQMKYRTRIELDGHNDSGETPLPGSIYYIDVCNNYSEPLGTAKFTLSLNTANDWILDAIEAKEGYNVSYDVNECNPNEVTFTVSSSKMNSNKVVMFSIPVRVFNPLLTNGTSDGTTVNVSGKNFKAPLSVEMTSCLVNGAYGNYDKFSVSELDAVRIITRHNHTANKIDDKPATVTEAGYTGRTYCDECQSVVDWGEILKPTGHHYAIVDGQFVCQDEDCGEVYEAGTGLFEMNNHTYYAIAGNLMTDWQEIDGQWYYFDHKTYTTVASLNNGYVTFTFNEQGKLDNGVWLDDGVGRKYFYGPKACNMAWYTIDGYKYFFRDFHALTGNQVLSISANEPYTAYVFGNDGKLSTEAIPNGFFYTADGKYYIKNGALFGGAFEDGGNIYYASTNTFRISTGKHYVSAASGNGIITEDGYYNFDADGKLIVKNGFYTEGGKKVCYINDVLQKGTFIYEENTYYASSYDGSIKTGRYYVSAANGNGIITEDGYYNFDADGKLIVED